MRLFRSTVLVFAAMALAVVALKARQQKTGSPEDHLPSNITQLTAFGERASWSPDGQRIAFMSKSFGDAFVVDVKTQMIRLLTHYPNPGYLRVQYLPNGDLFLIGARTFTDIQTTRSRDQEMWVMKADAQGSARRARSQDLRGRGDLPKDARIAWSNTHGQYPDLLGEGESVIYTADIVYEGGQPKLANKKEVLRAKAPECTLEAQDFRKNDTELIYTCYRSPFADVFGVEPRHESRHDLPEACRRVQRGRGDLSRWRTHAGRVEPRADEAQLEFHRYLEVEARAEQSGFRADDAVGRLSRLQGIEPCSESRRSLVCLPVRSEHRRRRRGVRALSVQGSVADGAESPGPACRATGPSRRLTRRPTHGSWPS